MSNEGINRVTILGNLCADPELRYTQSNQGVLSCRIACNESYFDNNTKERKERVEYVTVVIWGKRGEALNKFLSKGTRVLVEGRLQTRSWDDKEGNKRYSTEVVATNVVLLGGKNGSRDRQDDEHAAHGSDDGAGQSSAEDFSSIPF